MSQQHRNEKIAKFFFLVTGLIAVASVLLIAFFVFFQGLQPFFPFNKEGRYDFWKFISGLQWKPNDEVTKASYGILYMIVGSLFSTLGAVILAVPIGILTAVYIAELAPQYVVKILQPAVELLSGIPSVLFGVFGLGFIVPIIMKTSPYARGQSLLAVILVLGVMILPIIVSLSVTALQAVPDAYREGSYALGASKIHTIFHLVIPAARSGLLAGIVLGTGRGIGETMAVMMVAGNSGGGIPTSLWQQIRPLTVNIAMEMGYSSGLHQEMLFATAVILFLFIFGINLILTKITAKLGDVDVKF